MICAQKGGNCRHSGRLIHLSANFSARTTTQSHTDSRFCGAFFAHSIRVWNHACSGSVGTRRCESRRGTPAAGYDELRRIAAARMAREQPGHTLQPTALVHEAWLRLGGSEAPTFQNRAHLTPLGTVLGTVPLLPTVGRALLLRS